MSRGNEVVRVSSDTNECVVCESDVEYVMTWGGVEVYFCRGCLQSLGSYIKTALGLWDWTPTPLEVHA